MPMIATTIISSIRVKPLCRVIACLPGSRGGVHPQRSCQTALELVWTPDSPTGEPHEILGGPARSVRRAMHQELARPAARTLAIPVFSAVLGFGLRKCGGDARIRGVAPGPGILPFHVGRERPIGFLLRRALEDVLLCSLG